MTITHPPGRYVAGLPRALPVRGVRHVLPPHAHPERENPMNLEHAVDAAARTQWEAWTTAAYPVVPVRRWDHLSDTERDDVRALVRPIVEAAAPWVAQDTLRGYAEEWVECKPTTAWYAPVIASDAHARADEIQAVTR